MSHLGLEINGAAGTGGDPGRLLVRGFVGKEESFVVPLIKTPLGAEPAALFWGKSVKETSKNGGGSSRAFSIIYHELYIQRQAPAEGRGREPCSSLPAWLLESQIFPSNTKKLPELGFPSGISLVGDGMRLSMPAPRYGSDPMGKRSHLLPHIPSPSQITQTINEGGGKGYTPPPTPSAPDPSDLDLSPEGLLDVVGVLGGLSLSPDGQRAVVPQRRRHRCGVHVFGQLAFVGEGVHDGAVRGQLGKIKKKEG